MAKTKFKKKLIRRDGIDLRPLTRVNDAIRESVSAAYWDELPVAMRADAANDNGDTREDAGETAMVAGALTAAAIEAIAADFPEIMYTEAAPLQPGIDEGATDFEWQEYTTVGMAKIIANGADDLPNVAQYMTKNTGKIEGYGIAYSYTDQDLRSAAFARRNGRQAIVLDPDKAIAAREVAERTMDRDGAYGNTTYGIPGFFKSSNVTVAQSPLPAVGTNRNWRMGDKNPREVLQELRNGVKTISVNSKGSRRCTAIAMGIEMAEYLAATPLNATGDNQISIMAEFLRAQREANRPITIIAWVRASTADAAGTGDRVVFYERSINVLGRVQPMLFRAAPPTRRDLTTRVANEARFGGIYFKRPLGALYVDFV
jgi:hypothetical protein